VKTVNRIRSLYANTVEFERDGHRIRPPKELKRAHDLQRGWAAPIRDGIQQVFTFLQKVLQAKNGNAEQINFTIVIDGPATVDEYCEELARAESRIPEILRDEGEIP